MEPGLFTVLGFRAQRAESKPDAQVLKLRQQC
jgi:hypothetical protein